MTLQLKSTRLDDTHVLLFFFSSRGIKENFSNMKRYSTELTRQSIWSLQKSFCPSFCWVWGNSYFSYFLAHRPSHLLTSGSSFDHVCTPVYLLGNKSEGSLDPTKHTIVSILYPQLSISATDLGLPTCQLVRFLSVWSLRFSFFLCISFFYWVLSGLPTPGCTNPSGRSRVEGWAVVDSHRSDSMSECSPDA